MSDLSGSENDGLKNGDERDEKKDGYAEDGYDDKDDDDDVDDDEPVFFKYHGRHSRRNEKNWSE